MKFKAHILFMLLALAWGQASWPSAAAKELPGKPVVVATIPPIAMLGQAGLTDAVEIQTLINGAQSPHEFALSPSMVQLLSRADIVLWAGPEIENALAGKLPILAPDAQVIQLGRGGDHFWLDPARAAQAVLQIQTAVPQWSNGQAISFAGLSSEISILLRDVKTKPFLAMHNGYEAFSSAFDIAPLAVVGVDHDAPLSARRVMQIRALMKQHPNMCVFVEPQFHMHELEPILDGRMARLAPLDLLGGDVGPGTGRGSERYQKFMLQFAQRMAGCLADQAD